MEISKKFAKNIKEIAKSKKLKLGEIEKNAGVTPGYLSRLATNEQEMRIDTAFLFCKAVGMSFEEVMNYEPEFIIEVTWKNNKLYMKRGKEVVAVMTREELQASFAKTEKEMTKKLDDLLGVEENEQTNREYTVVPTAVLKECINLLSTDGQGTKQQVKEKLEELLK